MEDLIDDEEEKVEYSGERKSLKRKLVQRDVAPLEYDELGEATDEEENQYESKDKMILLESNEDNQSHGSQNSSTAESSHNKRTQKQ